MAADADPIEILLHLPLLAEDKVSALSGAFAYRPGDYNLALVRGQP